MNSNLVPIFDNKVLAENEDLSEVKNIPDFKHASPQKSHENVQMGPSVAPSDEANELPSLNSKLSV